jgi:hypothetical protein
MFRRQKPASRVFLGTVYGLTVLGAALIALAIRAGDYSRRTAADYAAAVHQNSEHYR